MGKVVKGMLYGVSVVVVVVGIRCFGSYTLAASRQLEPVERKAHVSTFNP